MAPETISRDVIQSLLDAGSAETPRVSIYLPVRHDPDELKKNDTRLKNLVREARRQLEAFGVEAGDADAILEPAASKVGDPSFWAWPESGRALFLDEAGMRQVSLPVDTGEFVVAAPRFHLKPLFGALPYVQPYYVFALAQNDVALFEGNGLSLARVDLDPDAPTSLKDVAGHERTEPRLQHHAGHRGSSEAIFHGQGSGKDDTDAEVETFLRRMGEVLEQHTKDGRPVLLAGVGELLAEFRRRSGNRNLVDEEIDGNVEHLTVAELHEKSWPIIRRRLDAGRKEKLATLESGNLEVPVSTGVEDVVIAAVDGRVSELFVASDAEHWGAYDEERRRVTMHDERRPGDSDLLDYAAASSFANGARVYEVPASEIPGDRGAIAELRY